MDYQIIENRESLLYFLNKDLMNNIQMTPKNFSVDKIIDTYYKVIFN